MYSPSHFRDHFIASLIFIGLFAVIGFGMKYHAATTVNRTVKPIQHQAIATPKQKTVAYVSPVSPVQSSDRQLNFDSELVAQQAESQELDQNSAVTPPTPEAAEPKESGDGEEELDGQESPIILPGETAPHFACTVPEYERIADQLGGVFVLFDGETLIRLGNRLTPPYQTEFLTEDWFLTYAKRMGRLPNDHLSRHIIRKASAQFSELHSEKTRLLLSIPKGLDKRIFESQIAWFKNRRQDVDVDAITVGRFHGKDGSLRFIISNVLVR